MISDIHLCLSKHSYVQPMMSVALYLCLLVDVSVFIDGEL